MGLKVQDFNINFGSQLLQNTDKLITPFKVIFQTSSKKIETHLKKNYSDFLSHRVLNISELSILLELKKYIKSNLDNSTLNEILNYFFERYWLLPFSVLDKIAYIEIKEVNAKWWADINYPYIELEANIVLDLKRIVNLLFEKKLIKIEFDVKFSKNEILLNFVKPLPLLTTYLGGGIIKQFILKYIESNITKNDFYIVKELQSVLKKNNLNDFKAQCKWEGTNIKILIDSFGSLNQFKGISKSKLFVAGFVGRYLYKRYKIAKKIETDINKFEKILNNMRPR